MIVKIGHGTRLIGALTYNFQKVDKGLGQVLFTQNIRQSVNGGYSLMLSYRSFEPYLIANRNTEKPSLHISLNPDPKDNVDDNLFICLAMDYMQEMGYGNQPYIVFRHNDIERTHIHIVSINVNESGKKISDTYEHRRSMSASRKLEKKYGLRPPVKDEERVNPKLFKPVDCRQTHIKSQIAAVVRYLPQFYTYQSLGAYNALLSLFNITVNEVSGELNGKTRQGLVYFATDSKGQKAGPPFKASLFGKHAGLDILEKHFEKSKLLMAEHPSKTVIKNSIEAALHMAKGENDFKQQLLEQGVNVVVRRNDEGRVYGITFIDHESRIVWNGSHLGKSLSANVYNNWWNKEVKIDSRTALFNNLSPSPVNDEKNPFGFLTDKNSGIFEALANLLPESQGEDYEELDFEKRMKKKRKH